MEKLMTLPDRILRLAAPLLGFFSVLLILAAGNLFFAAWLFFARDRQFWAWFWAAGGAVFVSYAAVTMLALARRIPPPMLDVARPVLQLGAGLFALAGAAWPVQTVIRWRQTGDLEAYGVVIGLIMLAEGVAAFVWLTLSPRKAAQ
jgi:hypothetical protein